MIRVRLSNICNLLLLLFMIMVTLGAYFETNVLLVALFICITGFIALINWKRVIESLKSPIVKYWWIFVLVTIASMVFNGTGVNKFIFAEISIFFIVYILVTLGDDASFYRLLRDFILLLSILTCVTYVLGLDFFASIKAGTPYVTLDLKTGGMASIFEFRHYYACYLAIALLATLRYPFPNKISQWSSILIFSINIFLTSTRTIWFALLVLIIFNTRLKNKFEIRRNIVYTTLILSPIFIFVMATSDLFSNVWLRLTQIFETEQNFGGVRLYTLTNGIMFILQNWPRYFFLGGGPGFAMVWLNLNPYGFWTNAIDSQYVTIFMDFGIFGLVTFLIPILYKIFNKRKDIEQFHRHSMFILAFSSLFFEVIGATSSIFVLWMTVFLSGIKINQDL